MNATVSAINTVKEEFFEDFPDPFLHQNKQGKRPHYLVEAAENEKILWLIPLSSKVRKYEKIMRDKKRKGKPCDGVYVCEVGKRKQVFVIQDMFPITKEYLEAPFIIDDQPYRLSNERHIKNINRKANCIKLLAKKGVKISPTQPNIALIENQLLKSMNFM